MDSIDLITVDTIIGEAISVLDDSEFSHGLSKGWYISRVRDAMDELAVDTFNLELTTDIDIDHKKMAVKMPSGAFNIREMYLHNGVCEPTSSKIVHWKRQFNNNGAGAGHTAKIKQGQGSSDPYYPSYRATAGCNNLCYANISNGLIMLSSNSSGYTKLRVIYNGTYGDVGDVPVIPRFFKRAVIDYIEERFFMVMKSRDPRKWRSSWVDASNKLNSRDGSWKKSRIRASSMHSWEKQSIQNSLSNLSHK